MPDQISGDRAYTTYVWQNPDKHFSLDQLLVFIF